LNTIDFIKAYPYFFATFGGGLLVLVVGRIFLPRQQWHIMVWSGLLNIPCFPFLVFLEKEYWTQVRFGGWILGVEDVICSFWVAAMVWLVIALFLGNQMLIKGRIRIFWLRYFLMAYLSGFLFLLFYFTGFGGMGSLFLACLIVTAFLLFRIRNPWLLFLTGIILHPVFYSLEVKLFFWVWPDFINRWNMRTIWGSPLLGIPLGETTWSVIFGAYWPLLMAYVFDLRLSPWVSIKTSAPLYELPDGSAP
jgi:hypothetical protein